MTQSIIGREGLNNVSENICGLVRMKAYKKMTCNLQLQNINFLDIFLFDIEYIKNEI